jgi:hypothetical protein
MEEFKDYVVRKVTTCKKHYWVESEQQDQNSELLSVNCLNCPTGASINPQKFKIVDGKICSIH